MKTAGVIGGLGPQTTAEFYLEVSFETQKRNKTNRPPILIWSVPIPYDVEKEAIVGGNYDRCLTLIIDAAQKLEKAGSDFLVMPCNSLHVFIKDIRQVVKIPVLNIVEETAQFLLQKSVTKAGILSTAITTGNQLYEKALEEVGIKSVKPDDFQQAKLGKIIHNLVINRHSNKDRKELINIVDSFREKDVSHVILACTDLQLLIPKHEELKIHDTMQILVNSAVSKILE